MNWLISKLSFSWTSWSISTLSPSSRTPFGKYIVLGMCGYLIRRLSTASMLFQKKLDSVSKKIDDSLGLESPA